MTKVNLAHQVKELTESQEIRNHFCEYLFQTYKKYRDQVYLQDYSFYPIKEMLVEILGVAEEKKDLKSAFIILLCTQKIALETSKDSETKQLFEFYYSLGMIRNRAFWSAAISHYKTVSFIDPDR